MAQLTQRSSLKISRSEWIAVAVLAILAIALRLVPGPRIIDDAYITFRYARNIIHGIGFVYNPGEAVLGTTTPLYTLFLALIGLPGGADNLPIIAIVINALADGVGAALLFLTARRLTGEKIPGIVLAVLWSVSPRSVTFAISGMETSFYVALMLGAFHTWLDGRSYLTSILMGLAILTRPDALIWAGPLGLAMIWERLTPIWQSKKLTLRSAFTAMPWTEGAIILAVLAPWLIYGSVIFGSPLTRSFIAKLAAYERSPFDALGVFAVNYGIPFYEQATFGSGAALFGLVIYTALSITGMVWLVRREWRMLPIVIFPHLYLVVFAIYNIPIFYWYLIPPMPIYLLCIICGIWGISQAISRPLIARAIIVIAGITWMIFSLNGWVLHPRYGQDRPNPITAWNEPELAMEQAGRDLAPLAHNKRIAVGDIGAVGWYSDAQILDVVGLVSPEATPYYPIDPSLLVGKLGFAFPPEMIFDLKPDYLVLFEAYGSNGLFKDPRFKTEYRLLKTYPVKFNESERLMVFERIVP